MKLLALSAVPSLAAATRYRITALLPYLRGVGIDVDVHSFLSDEEFARFYTAPPIKRGIDIIYAASRYFSRSLRSMGYDGVLVQREAALIGPAVGEAWLARKIPLILDYDDAIWLRVHSGVRNWVRNGGKYPWLFRNASALIAGSNYLAQEGASLAREGIPVSMARTVVDTQRWMPIDGRIDGDWYEDIPTLGWVGSRSTAAALFQVEPALRRLRQNGHRFRVRIVGGGDFRFSDFEAEYADWTLGREVSDFAEIDIGLAPMLSDAWWFGKCGFKQIQFMSVGVPTVSTPLGPVHELVDDGRNGLLARSSDDWAQCLERLLLERDLRRHLARESRRDAVESLCVRVQGPRVARFVQDTLLRRR